MNREEFNDEEQRNLETMKQCRRIMDALPEGIENHISLKELSSRICADERTTKSLILTARLNGHMICSLVPDRDGYFLPSDEWEALASYKIFKKREATASKVTQGMRAWFLKRGIDPDIYPEKEEGEDIV